MGSLKQLDNKYSLKRADDDAVPTAGVFNLQVASNPTHADRFFVSPYVYRIVSAGGSAWEDASQHVQGVRGTRYITLGANVSATMSAVSSEINLANGGNEGVTAVCAAGSRTDVTLTTTIPGNRIECYIVGEGTASDIVITETTVGTGADPLPEGYTSYKTSAGNTVNVTSPGEATFLRESGRHPSQEV